LPNRRAPTFVCQWPTPNIPQSLEQVHVPKHLVTLSLYSFPWLKCSCSVSLFRHDHHSSHAGTARKRSLPSAAASRSTSVAPNVLLERMTSSCNVASFCSTRVSSASHDFAAPPGPALHEVNEITGERARASRKMMHTQMRRRVLSSYQADMIITPLYNRYKCYMVKRVLYDDERRSNAPLCWVGRDLSEVMCDIFSP
jgi:hypothetical protein